ncbi:hypothetical protein AVEN_93500-1 [Araneus ventricosus]|uniref:Reverse transcriptase RNase H-like domain-containing protein n=1 Tax=Araneus ventricosus TaxID=182803 RepID=A0A4Y2AQD7_ARAVE|nr:hypothetical protein AVEN_93500-1 [Araneus ventricosus]
MAFFSKKLIPAESSYSAYDHELLAIYSEIRHFHYMLEARQFTVSTDHKTLTYAFRQKNNKCSPRQMCQLDFISQFTTNTVHIPGPENVAAHVVSRVSAITFPSKIHYVAIAKAQNIYQELSTLVASQTSLQFKNVTLPNSMIEVMCDVSTGAYSAFRTCPLGCNWPLSSIKWLQLLPYNDRLVFQMARSSTFFSSWVSRFGVLAILATDQDRQFESSLFGALSKILGSQKCRTTGYNPQDNAMVEELRRPLKSAIKYHATERWTEVLPIILLGLRASLKEDVQCSPEELVFGTAVRLTGELFDASKPDINPIDFVAKLKSHMQLLRKQPPTHHGKRPI